MSKVTNTWPDAFSIDPENLGDWEPLEIPLFDEQGNLIYSPGKLAGEKHAQHNQLSHGRGGGGSDVGGTSALLRASVTVGHDSDFDTRVNEVTADMHERFPKLSGLLKGKQPHVTFNNGKHLPGRTGVGGEYKPDSGMTQVAWEKGDSSASPSYGKFTVSEKGPHNFRHELGHAVHTAVGNNSFLGTPAYFGKFKKAVKTVVDPSLKKSGEWTPKHKKVMKKKLSKYGATNFEEAFAESFAAYTHPAYKGDLPAPIHSYFEGALK